jgi:hypothetical protein
MKASELMTGDLVLYKYQKVSMVPLGENEFSRTVEDFEQIVRVESVNWNSISYKEKTAEGLEYYITVNEEYLRPVLLTLEILKKNNFKESAINLVAGYWYEDSGYSIGVSLNPTAADMNRAILVINLVTNFKVFLEDSSLPTDQKPFGVHNLQHAIRAAGVNKEIIV